LCKYSSLNLVKFFINEITKLNPQFLHVSKKNLSSLESFI